MYPRRSSSSASRRNPQAHAGDLQLQWPSLPQRSKTRHVPPPLRSTPSQSPTHSAVRLVSRVRSVHRLQFHQTFRRWRGRGSRGLSKLFEVLCVAHGETAETFVCFHGVFEMHVRKKQPVERAEWGVLLRWHLCHRLELPLSLDPMRLTFYGGVQWRLMVELLENRIDIIVEVELVEHKDGLRRVSS